jgi:predicted acyltransferase
MGTTDPGPAPERLRSLDALRGFDMFWIVGGDALGRAIGKWYYGTNDNWLHDQLEHVPWEGFRFYDLIFPLFLFLVGAVIPFSLAALRRRGASNAAVYWRIARRVVLLFALGLMCNGALQLTWLTRQDGRWVVDINNHLRVAGVLQRIALCYGAAAVIALLTGVRGQIVTVAAILLGYWAVLVLVPNPETGLAGDLSKEGNLSGYIDRTYLPGKIMKAYYEFGDNEGILSTIPAVATALLGVLAGQWLQSSAGPGRKALGLAAAGVACLALGELWAMKFPIIKNLWTSSFVLVAGGWSLLLLALFYAVIDGLKWLVWAFPFVVIGVNAITIYVVPRFIDFKKMSEFFFGGLVQLAGDPDVIKKVGDLRTVIVVAGVLFFQWLFLLWLYRQRLFLRV